MKKWIAMAAVLLFAVAGVAFAAQWGPGWMQGSHGWQGRSMSQRILALLDSSQFRSRVNLTDNQVSRLRQIITNTEKANIKTRSQMAIEGIDLRELLQAPKPDQSAVMKKVQQISELRGQMMKNNVQALLEAKRVLTPEQQEKVRQFIEQRFRERGWRNSRTEHYRGRMMTRPGSPPAPPAAPAAPAPPNQ